MNYFIETPQSGYFGKIVALFMLTQVSEGLKMNKVTINFNFFSLFEISCTNIRDSQDSSPRKGLFL